MNAVEKAMGEIKTCPIMAYGHVCDYLGKEHGCGFCHMSEINETILDALREKQNRDCPHALTLEELKERVGKKYLWRKVKKQAKPIVITEIDDRAIHYSTIGFSEAWTSTNRVSNGVVTFYDSEPKEENK